MDRYCKAIAVLQIGGGATAIAMTAWLFSNSSVTASALLLFLPFIAVFVLAMYSGVALWKGWRSGLWMSLVIQVLQLPKISSSVLDYELALGLKVTAGFFGSGAKVWGYGGADFGFAVPGGDNPAGLGVNLVALVCVIHLARHAAALLEEKAGAPEAVPSPPPREGYGRGGE